MPHVCSVCVCMHVHIHMYAYVPVPEQAKGIGSLELESTVFVSSPMWVLAIKLRSSGRAIFTLDRWTLFLSQALESWLRPGCLSYTTGARLHEWWLMNSGAWHEIHGSCLVRSEFTVGLEPSTLPGTVACSLCSPMALSESLLKVSPEAVFFPRNWVPVSSIIGFPKVGFILAICGFLGPTMTPGAPYLCV